MSILTYCAGLVVAVVCIDTAGAQSTPPSGQAADQLREVAGWLAGSFSNQMQAGQDKAFHPVTLHMQPMWKDRDGEHWLYVEQALAANPGKPYRQRVYRITWQDDGPVSEVYLLPGDPAAFVGAWRDTRVLDQLQPIDLRRKDGCSIWLQKRPDGAYQGQTPGTACASERDGAAYTKAEVTLDATLLTSWDRGFDAHDRQVWGSAAGPYRFERRSAR